MASPFLGIAAGLAQGIPQGLQFGSELAYRQQSMELQKQQADASNIAAFSNSLKIPDPAVRNLAMTRLLKGATGIDPESDLGKQTLAAINKSSDDMRASIAAQLPGMDPTTINYLMSDPAQLGNLLYQISSRKTAVALMSGLTNADGTPNTSADTGATPPTGSGDMGTGAPGAGGTTAAPTSGAGTPADGTKPATVPPAPTSPQQGVADQNRGTFQGGTRPKLGLDEQGVPLTWAPSTDPYVIKLNNRIIAAQALPAEQATQISTQLRDMRDTYIAGKNSQISHYIEAQQLQVAQGHLTIDQMNANLAAQRFHWDQAQPQSTLGKLVRDANMDLLTRNNGAAPKGLAIDTSTPSDNTAATTVPTPKAALGKTPNEIGKVNSEGNYDVTDPAILSAAGVKTNQRLVYNPNTDTMQVLTDTPTSVQTSGGQDEAQTGANAMQRGLNSVNNLLNIYKNNPREFGLAGTVKGTLQDWASQAQDLAQIIPFVGPTLKKLGLPNNYFDPKLTDIEMASHLLQALTSQALANGNKGMNSYSTIYKNTEELTDFTGRQSSAQVKAKLDVIHSILTDSYKDYTSQLPAGGTSGVPPTPSPGTIGSGTVTPAPSPAPASAPAKPATTTPRRDPATLSSDQKASLVGTKGDVTPSKFPVLAHGTSFLTKIPNGAIMMLHDGDVTPAQFDDMYGAGAARSVGYKVH